MRGLMSRVKFFILPFLLVFSIDADEWVQTDWSGGGGAGFWGDPTEYFNGTLNGQRIPGSLTLNAPSNNWEVMGNPDGAKHVWALLSSGDRIYAGVDKYPETGTGRVLFSDDNGHTWTAGGDLGSSDFVHSLLERSGFIYAGSDGAVYKSANAGTTWTQTGTLTGATDVNVLVVRNDTIYAGTGPNGDVFKSGDYSNWTNTGDLTGATLIWDMIVDYDGNIYAAGTKNGTSSCIFKSTNGGLNWDELGFSYDRCCYSLLQTSDSTLFAGTGIDSGNVYKSTDGGTSWIRTGDLGGRLSKVVYVLIETDDRNIYAGTQNFFSGIVFKSINGGESWSGTELGNSHVYSLLQTDNGFIFAGQDSVASYPVSRAAYDTTGNLTSSIYDTGIDSVRYGSIHWDADLNDCSLSVKVQASDIWYFWPEPETIEVTNDSLLPASLNNMRYIRYLFDVSSASSDSSPVINEIRINYSYSGTSVTNDGLDAAYLFTPIPNPFINSTGIRFLNPKAGRMTIDVYDICGRFVVNLLEGREKEGYVEWLGVDRHGNLLSPGVYFIRLDSEQMVINKKVIFMGQ